LTATAYATRMQKPTFIREINGLRVLAAFIVLAAHYSTVSGLTSGICLFFVVTGFLSGAKIKRAVAAGETLNFWPDLRSTLWRLLLPMHLVLIAISIWILTSVDVLHRADWLRSVFAMSLGYGNLYEIANATTYWDRTSILSPTLSLWAMSVLVQFAFVSAVVRFSVSRVAPKMKTGTRQIFLIFFGVLAVALSVLDTLSFDGSTTYHFSTTTWIWAFLLGLVLGGLSWRYGRSKFERRIADFLFFAILLMGILPVFGLEPIGTWVRFAFGFLAVVALLGPTDGSAIFQGFLNSKPMQYMGGLTFGIYLVHWPLLIAFRYYTDSNRDQLIPQHVQEEITRSNNQMTWYFAVGLTLACVLLAWVLQKIVDFVVRFVDTLKEPKQQLTQYAALAFLPILVFGLQGSNIKGGEDIYKDLLPAIENANRDIPSYSAENCETGIVRVCRYGDEDAQTRIVIVGTSTAGQWFDALIPSADKYGWSVEVMVREGCTHATRNSETFCNNWRDAVVERLKSNQPDLIFMETTHSNELGTNEAASAADQRILKPLVEAGIPIAGIRATPRFNFFVPECIAANVDYQTVCGIDAGNYFLSAEEYRRQIDATQFVELIDLTSEVCPSGFCGPVENNIIRYVDDKHFTKTYSKSLSDALEPYLLKALGL
jgi:peptidoglycan/LPS O-acetylase OafA/YrhL